MVATIDLRPAMSPLPVGETASVATNLVTPKRQASVAWEFVELAGDGSVSRVICSRVPVSIDPSVGEGTLSVSHTPQEGCSVTVTNEALQMQVELPDEPATMHFGVRIWDVSNQAPEYPTPTGGLIGSDQVKVWTSGVGVFAPTPVLGVDPNDIVVAAGGALGGLGAVVLSNRI